MKKILPRGFFSYSGDKKITDDCCEVGLMICLLIPSRLLIKFINFSGSLFKSNYLFKVRAFKFLQKMKVVKDLW